MFYMTYLEGEVHCSVYRGDLQMFCTIHSGGGYTSHHEGEVHCSVYGGDLRMSYCRAYVSRFVNVSHIGQIMI